MVKFQTVRQKARIILNSEDAIKTIKQTNTIPIMEEAVAFDGSVGNNVDITTDRIHIIDHQFLDNEPVLYTSAGVMTATPAITNNTTLYVRYVSDNIFQLATAANGAAINITATASSTQTLTRTITFNGSDAQVVDVDVDENQVPTDAATGYIFINTHNLRTGMKVKYETTGAQIGALVNGQIYYAIYIDADTIQLATTLANANHLADDGTLDPIFIRFTGLGQGATHTLKKIVTFDINASPVVNLATDTLNLPNHNFTTGDMVVYHVDTLGYAAGTAITGLVDNMYYYVIVNDNDTIQLALTYAHATSAFPTAINLTAIGTGQNHSLKRIMRGPTRVCTNYKFKLDNKPVDLNDKCKLAVQSFDYIKNYNTQSCKSVGGVYFRNLFPSNTFSSQSDGNGTMLLSTNFLDTFDFQNNEMMNNSIPLPNNINNILNNDLDIFVDTKKRDIYNQDINGCIDDDAWSMVLVIYELDEYELVNKELDTKIKNSINPRLC